MLIDRITMEEFLIGLEKTQSVIVPFGSVEEHGRHLPLGTDTLHVHALARETSLIRPVFVAPPVWYGLCRSTARHPGTITISGLTVRTLAIEIASSLYGHGLRNFILISGHAGGTHMAALTDAGEEILERLSESRVAVLSILELVADLSTGLVETPGDSHAGEVETSLMLEIEPDLIRRTSPEEYPSFPRPILVRNKRRYWPGGVWGNPAAASRDKGRRILAEEARLLARLIDRIESHLEE